MSASVIGPCVKLPLSVRPKSAPTSRGCLFDTATHWQQNMGVGEKTATTLAMIIHELATNSVKHGCLSAEAGMLHLSSRSDDQNLVLVWAESGGPEVAGAPHHLGFGANYVKQTIARQFGGALDYDWQRGGLVATIRMRNDLLSN